MAVTLRKPPQADVDTFIAAGIAGGSEPAASAPVALARPAASHLDEVITGPEGRAFREMTVYLPNDLARRLSLHCLESDRDVSNVMAEFVKARLDAPVVAATPVPAFAAPRQSLLASNIEMGREIVLSLWRIRPWAH